MTSLFYKTNKNVYARIYKYGKIADVVHSYYLLSFKGKLRSPSYCCSVLLNPRIYTIILPGKLKYVLRIKCFKVAFKKVYTGATKIWT